MNRAIFLLIILLCAFLGLIGCTTPLINAVKKGDIDIVKNLLDNGADVNDFIYTDQESPLFKAATSGQIEMVKLLLKRGADIEGSGGGAPLKHAAERGQAEVVQLLIQNGADINKIRPDWRTCPDALSCAVRAGYPDIVKILLDAGARIPGSAITSSITSRYTIITQVLEEAQRNRHQQAHKTTIFAQNNQVLENPFPEKEQSIKNFQIDTKNINFGNYHALVIGNNNYLYVAKLNTAVNDAKSVGYMLQNEYGFKVKLIVDGTRNHMLEILDAYRAKLTQNDNLLIYYAGHGYYDKEAERGYWLPVDAKETTKAAWLSNVDITDTLKATRAKHVMIVADSCYSGALTRSIHVKLRSPEWLSRISRKKSRTVLTSGGLEPVSDSGGGVHSVFAKVFLDVLKENTGIMDGTLFFSKLRRPVMVNSDQTPQYSDIRKAGHDGGDFLFVRKKVASK